MKVTRGDILSSIQQRRGALEGKTSAPSARAAAHQLAHDEAVLQELPDGSATEMKAFLQAEESKLTHRKWTLAAAGFGMLVGSGVSQIAKGPIWLSLGLGVGGMATVFVGGTSGDKADRAASRRAVVERWERHLIQKPTSQAVREPTTLIQNRLESVSSEDLKSELLNVMSATREHLQQTRASDPAAAAAIWRLTADERTISAVEGESLEGIRARIRTENEEHARLASLGKKVCLGTFGVAAGLMALELLTPVPAKLPAIGLTLLAVGVAVKSGLTEDKIAKNNYAAGTISRWEPLLESQKKIAAAPEEVRRLSEGPHPVEDIEIVEDGLMIGDHFIEL